MIGVKDATACPVVKMIKPNGRIDRSNYKDIYRQAIAVIETAQPSLNEQADFILVDMQDVRLIDSCGLGTLIALLKAARINGKQLALCSIRPNVKMLLGLTSAFKVFNVFPSDRHFWVDLERFTSDACPLATVAA
ncbi:anti-sigma-factor antagonist [Thalassoporum mexicanum PCC 7367]|nr:STAS domain-containing protein [Pseudanabaena sp. PCC 7367]AFY70202.1 anti-sigma-factor antagonist [Pseudanabaena sp. PCC 7367]